MEEEYEHDPDDGHTHQFEFEEDLPDTGVAGVITVICIHCGMLSTQDI
jgi:hypothetical protein